MSFEAVEQLQSVSTGHMHPALSPHIPNQPNRHDNFILTPNTHAKRAPLAPSGECR